MSVHEIEVEDGPQSKISVIPITANDPYYNPDKFPDRFSNGRLVLRIGTPPGRGSTRRAVLKPTEALQVAMALLAVSLEVLETERSLSVIQSTPKTQVHMGGGAEC